MSYHPPLQVSSPSWRFTSLCSWCTPQVSSKSVSSFSLFAPPTVQAADVKDELCSCMLQLVQQTLPSYLGITSLHQGHKKSSAFMPPSSDAIYGPATFSFPLQLTNVVYTVHCLCLGVRRPLLIIHLMLFISVLSKPTCFDWFYVHVELVELCFSLCDCACPVIHRVPGQESCVWRWNQHSY